MRDKLQQYTIGSLCGGALFLSFSLRAIPVGQWTSNYSELAASAILGVIAGSLFKYFHIQMTHASRVLGDVLVELRASSTYFSRISSFQQMHDEYKQVDMTNKLQEWAVHSAFKYSWVVPADTPEKKARERFCEYLSEGLDHCQQWLGIHEDRLSFFFGPESKAERRAYMEALRQFKYLKTRVLVVTDKNAEDFENIRTIKGYLKSVDGHNIVTYAIDQRDFDDIVRPWRHKSFKDWALYDDSVLLEFDEEQRIVSFHVRDSLVEGVNRLRLGLSSAELKRKLRLINTDYLKKLKPDGTRIKQSTATTQPPLGGR